MKNKNIYKLAVTILLIISFLLWFNLWIMTISTVLQNWFVWHDNMTIFYFIMILIISSIILFLWLLKLFNKINTDNVFITKMNNTLKITSFIVIIFTITTLIFALLSYIASWESKVWFLMLSLITLNVWIWTLLVWGVVWYMKDRKQNK